MLLLTQKIYVPSAALSSHPLRVSHSNAGFSESFHAFQPTRFLWLAVLH